MYGLWGEFYAFDVKAGGGGIDRILGFRAPRGPDIAEHCVYRIEQRTEDRRKHVKQMEDRGRIRGDD